MAKAPGTYVENGVRCTMGAPFSKATSQKAAPGGMNGQNKAPFDKPQGMGGGSIPTRFFDAMPATAAKTVNAGMKGTSGANVTQPVGTRRFKSPK